MTIPQFSNGDTLHDVRTKHLNPAILRINALETNVAGLTQTTATLSSTVSENSTIVNSLLDVVAEISTENESLITNTNALTLEVSQNKADIASVKGITTDQASKISSIQSSATALSNRVSAIEIDALPAKITALESSTSAISGRVSTLENGSAALTSRVSQLETSSLTFSGKISAIETAATSLTSRVDSLDTKLTALTTRVSDLEALTARTKVEVIWNNPVTIPNTSTNLIALLKGITPSYGSLTSPLIDLVNNRIQPLAKNKTLFLKVSFAGAYATGSSDKAFLFRLGGGMNDSFSSSRNPTHFNAATDTITFFTMESVGTNSAAVINGIIPTVQVLGRTNFVTSRIIISIDQ